MSNDHKEATEHYQSFTSLWFGKYKGIPLCEVPADYLMWVRQQPNLYQKFSRSLKKAINANIPLDLRLKHDGSKGDYYLSAVEVLKCHCPTCLSEQSLIFGTKQKKRKVFCQKCRVDFFTSYEACKKEA